MLTATDPCAKYIQSGTYISETTNKVLFASGTDATTAAAINIVQANDCLAGWVAYYALYVDAFKADGTWASLTPL